MKRTDRKRSRTDTEDRLLFAQERPLRVALPGRGRSLYFKHRDFVTEILKPPFYLRVREIRLTMTDPPYKFTCGS